MEEYANSLVDLANVPRAAVKPIMDPLGFGFDNEIDDARINYEDAEAIAENAAVAAAKATESLAALCSTGNDSCWKMRTDELSERLLRRPADARELAIIAALPSQPTARERTTLTLEFLFQSSGFLYRSEIGGGGGTLDDYEIASLLAFTIWKSPPDRRLLDAARGGSLSDPSKRRAEIARMLADSRAAAAVQSFLQDWLDLRPLAGQDKAGLPDTVALADYKNSVTGELGAFAKHLLSSQVPMWPTLFETSSGFWDAALARVLDPQGPATADRAFVERRVPGRLGVISFPIVQMTHSTRDDTSIVGRGKFLFEQVLCGVVPPPPADVPMLETGTARTQRERLAEHRASPACASCHAAMDPLGIAFEEFDQLGRFRTSLLGAPVDTSGSLPGGLDVAGSFGSRRELMVKLQSSEQVRTCFAQQLVRYVLGRVSLLRDPCASAAPPSADTGFAQHFAALLADERLYRRF